MRSLDKQVLSITANGVVRINVLLSWVRRKLRCSGYWSLAGYAKQRVKGALEFIYGFEAAVVHYARQSGADGVVCGHIHSAVIKEMDGITYMNCGDWVDSCTALVEHWSGRIELRRWDRPRIVEPAAAPAAMKVQ